MKYHKWSKVKPQIGEMFTPIVSYDGGKTLQVHHEMLQMECKLICTKMDADVTKRIYEYSGEPYPVTSLGLYPVLGIGSDLEIIYWISHEEIINEIK